MDKGLTVRKMGADKLVENPPNAQIVCPSPKVWDFDEKRLYWASIVGVCNQYVLEIYYRQGQAVEWLHRIPFTPDGCLFSNFQMRAEFFKNFDRNSIRKAAELSTYLINRQYVLEFGNIIQARTS